MKEETLDEFEAGLRDLREARRGGSIDDRAFAKGLYELGPRAKGELLHMLGQGEEARDAALRASRDLPLDETWPVYARALSDFTHLGSGLALEMLLTGLRHTRRFDQPHGLTSTPVVDALLFLIEVRWIDHATHIRSLAAKALALVRPPAARLLPALLPACEAELEQTPHVSALPAILELVAQLGDEASAFVPMLAETVENSTYTTVVKEAARTLGRLGELAAESLPALEGRLRTERDPATRKTLDSAVAKIQRTPTDAMAGLDGPRELVDVLRRVCIPEAEYVPLPGMAAVMKRPAAFEEVQALDSPAFEEGLEQLADQPLSRNARSWVAVMCSHYVENTGSERIRRLLSRMVELQWHPSRMLMLTSALERAKVEGRLEVYRRLIETSPRAFGTNLSLINAYLDGQGERGHAVAEELVRRHPETLGPVLSWLARHASKSSAPFLLELLCDGETDEDSRRVATGALCAACGAEAIAMILEAHRRGRLARPEHLLEIFHQAARWMAVHDLGDALGPAVPVVVDATRALLGAGSASAVEFGQWKHRPTPLGHALGFIEKIGALDEPEVRLLVEELARPETWKTLSGPDRRALHEVHGVPVATQTEEAVRKHQEGFREYHERVGGLHRSYRELVPEGQRPSGHSIELAWDPEGGWSPEARDGTVIRLATGSFRCAARFEFPVELGAPYEEKAAACNLRFSDVDGTPWEGRLVFTLDELFGAASTASPATLSNRVGADEQAPWRALRERPILTGIQAEGPGDDWPGWRTVGAAVGLPIGLARTKYDLAWDETNRSLVAAVVFEGAMAAPIVYELDFGSLIARPWYSRPEPLLDALEERGWPVAFTCRPMDEE